LKNLDSYLNEDVKLAALAKALSHPARLQILRFLHQKEACFCGDLVSEIGLAQATVSQHLKELKNQGIIQGKISGPAVCYCIDTDFWEEMKGYFEAFLSHSLPNKSNCC
jgi:ArsR family transcriptional regulator